MTFAKDKRLSIPLEVRAQSCAGLRDFRTTGNRNKSSLYIVMSNMISVSASQAHCELIDSPVLREQDPFGASDEQVGNQQPKDENGRSRANDTEIFRC